MGRSRVALAALLPALGLIVSGSAQGTIVRDGVAKRPLRDSAAKRQQLYVSPRGSDAGRCSKHAPCRSFQRAFRVASPGAIVRLAAGDYTSPCAPLTGAKSNFVTFVGPRAARVFCQLGFVHASHVAVRGPTLYQIIVEASSNLRFQNVAVTCKDKAPYALYPPADLCDARISLESSDHLRFDRVAIGPTYDSSACGGEQTNYASDVEDVFFKSVTFHDARWQGAPCGGPDGSGNQHSENFYFSGLKSPARNVTFDSCRFTNGASSGKVSGGGETDGSGPDSASLFLTGAFDHLIVRNCVFDGTGAPSIDGATDAPITNSLIENNTWTRTAFFQYPSYPSLAFVNNLGAQQSCPVSSIFGSSGGTFSHNLWYYPHGGGSADRCGPTDLTVNGPGAPSSLFAHYGTGNYELKRGSPAVGRADPRRYATRDFTGLKRPQGKLPDVGAYELPVKTKHKHAAKPKHKHKAKRRSG
jgi:hypothetical protein